MMRPLSLALLFAVSGTPAMAQTQDPSVVIEGGRTTGVATVNATAGIRNQQANVGAIAVGGTAVALPTLDQVNTAHSSQSSSSAAASIADGAFAGSSGWTAVSGAAGNDNQQANIAAFAFGIEAGAVTDLTLSQARASQEPTGTPGADAASPERAVAIADSAFEGSSGLVQVSLIGGDRNTSANSFALSVSADAKP